MRAGTVHVPLLSWQNQSSWAVNVCTLLAVNSCLNAWLLMCSSLYTRRHAHSQTEKKTDFRLNGLEKHIGKLFLITSDVFSFSLFTEIPSTVTAYFMVNPVVTECKCSQKSCHFLYFSANLRGTAANYNLELMNYGICAHRTLLCPQINLSDFPSTVRVDFFLMTSWEKITAINLKPTPAFMKIYCHT